MKCKIKTEGFFIDRSIDFGVSKDLDRDSYVVIDNSLIINSFNGVYHYPEAYRDGKWIAVPPQIGTYEGPAAGLDRIYGIYQRVSDVFDIETNLPGGEGILLKSHQYQCLRHKAELPTLGHPFMPVPCYDPF
jgi:hypothetical protein